MEGIKIPVSKRTIRELLEIYLQEKGFGDKTTNKIINSVFDDVAEHEEKRKEKRGKKAKVSHGTSCPRIVSPQDEMLVEF
jgi:signal transduction histidine kinase